MSLILCLGVQNIRLCPHLGPSQIMKAFENRFTFAKVFNKYTVVCFFLAQSVYSYSCFGIVIRREFFKMWAAFEFLSEENSDADDCSIGTMDPDHLSMLKDRAIANPEYFDTFFNAPVKNVLRHPGQRDSRAVHHRSRINSSGFTEESSRSSTEGSEHDYYNFLWVGFIYFETFELTDYYIFLKSGFPNCWWTIVSI